MRWASMLVAIGAAGCGRIGFATDGAGNPGGKPTVNPVDPVSVPENADGVVPISGTDPNAPADLTFTAEQTGTLSLINLVVTSASSTSASITFTAPSLPQMIPDVVTLDIMATNADGATSAALPVMVTVRPVTVTITMATYRFATQRLIVGATSAVGVTLTLQPYATQASDGASTFAPVNAQSTDLGGGSYSIDISSVPQPFCGPGGQGLPCSATPLVVLSSVGGTSPNTALLDIRQ